MDTTSNEKSDEIPEFFLEKKEKPEKKEPSKKSFGLKKKQAGTEMTKKGETSLVDPNFNRNKLFSKGINRMADEKLEDASHIFEMVLRINPNDVDALLKLGYCRFHLDDYTESMRAYDKVLDIDITNADAWNLKSLVFYERKVYGKALDCADKAIDSDPTFGMAWYNRACYLSMENQIPESLDALVRSIEIDVKNAKRAVKDKDFMNVRLEEGFRRIVEVVVIESLRQGYHTIGSIVWTTFLDKEDVIKCLTRLMQKGLVVKHEKRQVWSTIDTYDLIPEMANRIGTVKRGMLGIPRKSLPKPLKSLKSLAEAIQLIKSSIEEEEIEKTIEYCNIFIDTEKCGQEMIEDYLEEHREVRLIKIRLKDKGLDFLQDNKKKMLVMFENMEVSVTKKLRSDVARN
uniref:TPR repeat-containing protein (SKI3, TTC37) n=1 Tax=uncultured marine thaumarchaeote AD1000_01_A07 TaxID=1455878 RepID=A0A075FFS7_9ARCH|nr:TPR repeat-containing protein (SKI3, TTC37) [uncultured marine thaumarchaeote AD1000_01_A07]